MVIENPYACKNLEVGLLRAGRTSFSFEINFLSDQATTKLSWSSQLGLNRPF